MDEIGEKLDALLNDPKQFGKIAQLASSILGDGGGKQAPPSAPEPELDVDMGQLRRMMSALRGGGHDSANRHLLEAMKPYLAEKRRRKIDRAMKLARLASLAELAAEDLEGDIVNMGVRRAHLWHEREQAYKAELSPDCRRQCTGCGALALMTEGGKCDA